MDTLDPRAIAAGLILGTATALALRAASAGRPRLERASMALTAAAAILAPVAAFALTWRPRPWELEALLRGGGFLYGPALVTIALFLLGLSRPFARRRGALARLAQRPLFWILAPYAAALGILGGIALVQGGVALAAAGNATVTHALTAHFNAGTQPATNPISTAGNQLTLNASTTPSAATLSNNVTTGAIGAGAMSLSAPSGNIVLIIRGGGSTATQFYDASTGTISATAGPTLPTAVSTGGFAIQRDATTYTVVAGGTSTALIKIDPQGVAVGAGSCTVAFGVGCWTATSLAPLALSAVAGAGAHAIKRSDGKIIVIHGNKSRATTMYTPPSVGPEAAVAGPATPSGGGTSAIDVGALSIPRTADTKWITFSGNNSTAVSVYDPTVGATGGFSAYTGSLPIGSFGAGAHALQYTDSSAGKCMPTSAASAPCWLLIEGGGTGNSLKYDPAAAITVALNGAASAIGVTVSTGSYSFLRGDGSFLLVRGNGGAGTTTTRVWTGGATAAWSAGPTLSVGSAPNAGAHAFQRPTDGQYVLVGTNSTTVSEGPYDAGWTINAALTSEAIDPTFVGQWIQASWTTSTASGSTVTLSTRTATTSAGLTGAYHAFGANTSGSGTLGGAAGDGAVGDRWIQTKVTLGRPVPATADATSAWNVVWSAEDRLIYGRTPVASPVLSNFSLEMVLGQFTITAPASATAGTAFSSNVSLKDSASTTIADYTGSHTLIFSGANTAPDGTAPTERDGNSRDQPFGAETALPFTTGAFTGTTNVRLYKAETATLSAVEDFYSPVANYFLCGGASACAGDAVVQLTTAVAPSVVVGVTAVSAANSTLSPAIANVAAATVQAITVTALDSFKNPISGAATSLAASPAGPTLSAAGSTNASGVYSGTITTTTLGTYTVSATVAGTTITPTLAITFVTTSGKESTPTAQKDTQVRLATGDTLSATNVTGGVVSLNGSTAPGGAIAPAPPGIGFIGAGAHTLLGNGGQYLVVEGNDNNATEIYDGVGAFKSGPTLTDTSGSVALPFAVGLGGHSFKIRSGTNSGKFLLVGGGQGQGADVLTANHTLIVDPNGWAVANGPALSGPSGTATSGAGAGAFSIAFSSIPGFPSDTRTLIVHAGGIAGAGGTTNTSIFDAATNTIVAGPALSGNAGDGAFGIVRPGGTILIFHGNNSTGTTLYTPAASPGIGTTAAGPAAPTAITRGGHGISYTSGAAGSCAATSAASAPCILMVTGTTTATTKYDPALALGPGAFAAGPALTASAGVGANSLLRADGTYLVILGNTTVTTDAFTPSTGLIAVGPSLGVNAGIGAHALQQTDHEYLIFLGGIQNQTNLYAAGWNGSGTYTTEWVDPGNVDSWTQLGYTTALNGGTVTLALLVAKDNLGTAQLSAITAAAAGGAQTTALPLGSTSDRKWTQATVTFTRPVPATATNVADEQRGVFLSTGYAAQIRTQAASPTLSAVSFTYRSGYFRITAPTPQVAGVSFATSAFALVDDTSSSPSTGVITDYAATHTLLFSGAATAPNGTSVPTARNASAVDIAFGSATTISFASGAGATTLTLYKAETVTPKADETVNGQICPAPQSCAITASATVGTLAPSILVNPANPSAAQSTAAVAPSTLPADDVALSTLSIVVKDAFQNLSPGVNAPYRAVTITKSAGTSAFIAAPTGNVNASAAYSTTIRDGVAESVTLTIQISSGFDAIPTITLSSQPTITFAALTLVLTPLDGTGTPISGPTVTAGQAFGLKIEAHIVSPASTDVTFCDGAGSPAATCTLTFSTSAGSAPDGTVPRVASVSISGATFSAGFFTTGLAAFALVCANGNSVSCLTQTGSHTITATAVQAGQTPDAAVTLTGTSSGFTVNSAKTSSRNGFDANPAVQSFVLVSPSAAGTTAAVGVPTSVSAWARVVDGFGNAAENGRTVTFATTLGTLSAPTAATSASAAAAVYGFAGPVSLSAAAAGTATVSATVSDNGAAAQSAAASFFANLPRVINGTYYATLLSTNNAAPVAGPIAGKGVPLAVVATDSATKPALSVSGTTLVGSNACWTIGAGNATGGSFDPTGVAPGTCTGTTTTSGDVLAGQVAITSGACPGVSCRVSYWKAGQPGAVTLHAAAGNASFDYALTVAGYFRIATTTAPNGRLVTALVDWDGTTVRVIGWFAPEP